MSKYSVNLILHGNPDQEAEPSVRDIADLVWEAVSAIPTWDDQSIIVSVEMQEVKEEA